MVLNEISWYCSWKTNGSRVGWGLGMVGLEVRGLVVVRV